MSIIRRLFGKVSKETPVDESVVVFTIDPVTKAAARVERQGHCACLASGKKGTLSIQKLHAERQNPDAPGWLKLNQLIETAITFRSEYLEPSARVPAHEWAEVITLPENIGDLRCLKDLRLYGSHLRRLPPEIGRLSALVNLDIYTSYSLHWLPYEITRCMNLTQTRMSTRALYGNRNTGLPFPRLSRVIDTLAPTTCSVCDRPFEAVAQQLYWTTSRIGADEALLLIHSCSADCTSRVPDSPVGYRRRPHQGGTMDMTRP